MDRNGHPERIVARAMRADEIVTHACTHHGASIRVCVTMTRQPALHERNRLMLLNNNLHNNRRQVVLMNNTNELEENSEAGLENAASVDMNLTQPNERGYPGTPFVHGDWHRADILESPCKSAGWTRRMQKRMRRWIQSMAVGRKRLFGPGADADEDVAGSASAGSPSPRSMGRSASIAQELWPSGEPAIVAVPRTTQGIDHDRSSGSVDDEHLNPYSSDRDSDQLHISQGIHRLDGRDTRQRGIGSRSSETDAMTTAQNAMVTSISTDASRGASPPVSSIGLLRKRDECSVRAHRDQAPPSTDCTSSLDLQTRSNASDGKPNSEQPGRTCVTAAHSSSGAIIEDMNEPNQSRVSSLIAASRDCTSKVHRREFGTAQRSSTMGVCISPTVFEHDSFASDGTPSAIEEDAQEPERTASAAVSRTHTSDHAAKTAATSPSSVVGDCVRNAVSFKSGSPAGETELHVSETGARVSSLRTFLPTQVLLGALVKAHTQRDEIDRGRDRRSKPPQVTAQTPQSRRRARYRQSPSSAGRTHVSGLRFHSSVPDALSETLWRAITESSSRVAFMLPVALPPFAVLAQLCHRCNAQKGTRALIVLDDVPANDLNVSFVQQFALEILAYLRAVFGTSMAVATSLVFDPNVSIGVVLASSLTGLSAAYRAAHLGMVIVLLAGRIHWSENPPESAACRGAARLESWLHPWLGSLSGPVMLMMPLLPEHTQAVQLPGSVNAGQYRHISAFQHVLQMIDAPSTNSAGCKTSIVTVSEPPQCGPVSTSGAQLLVTNPFDAAVRKDCLRHRRQTLDVACDIDSTDAVFVLVRDGEHLLQALVRDAPSGAVSVEKILTPDASLPCGCLFLQHTAADYDQMVREIDALLRRRKVRPLVDSGVARSRHQRPLRDDAHRLVALHALRQAVTICTYDGPDSALAFLNQAHREYCRFYGERATTVRIIERSTLTFFERVRTALPSDAQPLIPVVHRLLTELDATIQRTESSPRRVLMVTDSPASALVLSTWARGQAVELSDREHATQDSGMLLSDTVHATRFGLVVIRSLTQLLQQRELASTAANLECTFRSYTEVVLIGPSARMVDLSGRARHWSDLGRGECIWVHLYSRLRAQSPLQSTFFSGENLETEYTALFEKVERRQVAKPSSTAALNTVGIWVPPEIRMCLRRQG